MLVNNQYSMHRRRIEFGMVQSAYTEVSDEDLQSLIRDFRVDYPDIGESMASDLLRSRGYKVTRARIRFALRSEDPLGSALHWPGGLTRRRVYSVAGPNSLWHIGIRLPVDSLKKIIMVLF